MLIRRGAGYRQQYFKWLTYQGGRKTNILGVERIRSTRWGLASKRAGEETVKRRRGSSPSESSVENDRVIPLEEK